MLTVLDSEGKKMNAHFLQHVPFEGLGSIEPWLRMNGHAISSTKFFNSAKLPNIDEVDFLIVMGGPMSANDEDLFPWLTQEKQFIRNAIKKEKPVMGICLGAQLIASAMGANVYQNPVKEIGWFPIEAMSPSDGSTFSLPLSMDVFHWHGETFDLPPGATLLAGSQGCKNQAFQIGRSIIGLQFHLEITPESVKGLVSNCRNELVSSRYVQTEEQILAAGSHHFKGIHTQMDKILSYLSSKTSG